MITSLSRSSRLCLRSIECISYRRMCEEVENVKLKSRIPVKRGLSCLRTHEDKQQAVIQLLAMKDAAGLSFDTIAKELGYTNVYTAQIFLLQAPIVSKEKAQLLRKLITKNGGVLSDDLLDDMQRCPLRTKDDSTLEDPAIYRMIEAMQFNGESLKMLINEKFGDGIMSSVDMKMTLKKVKGDEGENRVQIVLDGKFLPFREQLDSDKE